MQAQVLCSTIQCFGLPEALPFPAGLPKAQAYVGYSEGSPQFNMRVNFPEGSEVEWQLHDMQAGEDLVCRYRAIVRGGYVRAHLPARYAKRLEARLMQLRVHTPAAA